MAGCVRSMRRSIVVLQHATRARSEWSHRGAVAGSGGGADLAAAPLCVRARRRRDSRSGRADSDVSAEGRLAPEDSACRAFFHSGHPRSARTGTSQIVEQAVKAIGRDAAIERSRAWRGNFLTRSQVIAALRQPAPGVVSLEQYRGDLQMHSVWSDGSQTLEAIVTAVLARGYQVQRRHRSLIRPADRPRHVDVCDC